MQNDRHVRSLIGEGVSGSLYAEIRLAAQVTDEQLAIVCQLLKKGGWQPPKTHADVQFESRRSPVYQRSTDEPLTPGSFSAMRGDRCLLSYPC